MSEKRKFPVFLILLVFLLTGYCADAQKVKTVILDAGHGGYDTGALGKHSREKDITLAIVLKLRDYIKENLPDVKVILTRDTDDFVELYRRAKIANENNADLFISIHCNSNPSPTPFGTETYVMGLHKSNANLAVAKAENASILLEYDYVEKYDGFDPYSPEGNIFFSMMQNAFLDKSLDFAGKVETQFREKLNFFDRGVKQAGFLVLYKTAMPGVLIETGFLSNARDEKFLLSEKGQDQTASAIFRAFREYKYGVEKRDISEINKADSTLSNKQNRKPLVTTKPDPATGKNMDQSKPDPTPDNPGKTAISVPEDKPGVGNVPAKSKPGAEKKPGVANTQANKPVSDVKPEVANTQGKTRTGAEVKPDVGTAQVKTKPGVEVKPDSVNVPAKTKPVTGVNPAAANTPAKTKPAQDAATAQKNKNTVVYRVQFASSPQDQPLDAPEFKNLPDVWKYFQNGLYKFTSGKFDTAKKASAYKLELVNKGFTDAFVVPFRNDQRITIEEAMRLGGK